MSGYKKYVESEIYGNEQEGLFMTAGALFALLGNLIEQGKINRDSVVLVKQEGPLSTVECHRLGDLKDVRLSGQPRYRDD